MRIIDDFEINTLNAALLKVESPADSAALAQMVMVLTKDSDDAEDRTLDRMEEQLLAALISQQQKQEQPTFQGIYKLLERTNMEDELLSCPEVFESASTRLQKSVLFELELRLMSFRYS